MVNGKQNIQFKNLIDNNAEVSRVNHKTLNNLNFPHSRQQTSQYKLLLGQFWAIKYASFAPVMRELILFGGGG